MYHLRVSETLFATLAFGTVVLSAPYEKRAPQGPVITRDFPDPTVIKVENTFYAFSTQSLPKNAPIATSEDFASWQYLDQDALPNESLGSWVTTGDNGRTDVWAPAVIQRDDGSFVMYYSALFTSKLHCIGAAFSSSITGPFSDPSPNPLICPTDEGGAIDASGYRDADGQRYIIYKIDANAIGNGGNCNNGVEPILNTPIVLQPVEEDGVTFSGDGRSILDRDESDGPLIEAPSLVRLDDGRHLLFYSSNCYTTPEYDVGYAVSTSGVFGPYIKNEAGLLNSGEFGLKAPGGASVIDDGGLKMAFHAGDIGERTMWTAGLRVEGDLVSVA